MLWGIFVNCVDMSFCNFYVLFVFFISIENICCFGFCCIENNGCKLLMFVIVFSGLGVCFLRFCVFVDWGFVGFYSFY